MIRLAIGIGLVGAAAYFGSRTRSGLSAPARSYLERALDDVGQFALTQFPREEIGPGSSPLFDDPDYQMQCDVLEPYLASAILHLAEASDMEEPGADVARVLVNQAWSAAAQPGRCPKLKLPSWALEENA